MHPRGIFLPDIAALVIIDAMQLPGIGFEPERLILPQFAYAFEHADRQPMRAEGGRGIPLPRWRDPAMAKRRQARVERPVLRIRCPMHGQRIVPRDHDLAAQAIQGEALGQRIGLRRLAVDQHILAVSP